MLTLIAPCKLNLCLYVTGKRPDGFHNLQSVFTPLSFGDTMSFASGAMAGLQASMALSEGADSDYYAQIDAQGHQIKQAPGAALALAFMPGHELSQFDREHGIELTSTQPLKIKLQDNLIYRAVRLLQETSGQKFEVAIGIEKRIPMGGGLGGGSSNAATTLLALNHMFKLGLSVDKLAELGAQLGSDVPFFVHGTNALVEGRGEIITPIDLAEQYFLVVTPQVHVSTKDVFCDPALKSHYSAPRSHEAVLSEPFGNDLVPVVTKKFCEIGHTLERLVKYGRPAMSGSGASCFVACSSQEAAQAAFAEVTQHNLSLGCGYSVFVAHSMSPSATIAALAQSA